MTQLRTQQRDAWTDWEAEIPRRRHLKGILREAPGLIMKSVAIFKLPFNSCKYLHRPAAALHFHISVIAFQIEGFGMSGSKFMFVANLKELPKGDPEISCSQEWYGWMDVRTDGPSSATSCFFTQVSVLSICLWVEFISKCVHFNCPSSLKQLVLPHRSSHPLKHMQHPFCWSWMQVIPTQSSVFLRSATSFSCFRTSLCSHLETTCLCF